MKLLHIITGGTIGGRVPEYLEIEHIADIFNDTINFKKHITKSFNIDAEYDEIEVCRKDSREITKEDREIIVQTIIRGHNEGTNLFLITHGTFTMDETGKYLLSKLEKSVLDEVMVVLTGSMYPWNVYGSDAPLNLGASISQLLSTGKKGVHICMHGKLFDPKRVYKDTDNLIFQEHKQHG